MSEPSIKDALKALRQPGIEKALDRITELERDLDEMKRQLSERDEAVGKVVDSDMLGSPIMLWFKTPVIGTAVYTDPQVPEGWQLVPKEPTQEMMAAAWEQAAVYSKSGWAAMLAAAPQSGVNHE